MGNLASVLEAFPSWRPPLDHVLEVLPRLQPRYYSISSSPKVHPRRAHITAITVEYTTPTGAVRRGVCTSYFSRLSAGDRVECFIRTSSFRPPPPDVPCLMVGPGTGLAPFRGFVQDRDAARVTGDDLAP